MRRQVTVLLPGGQRGSFSALARAATIAADEIATSDCTRAAMPVVCAAEPRAGDDRGTWRAAQGALRARDDEALRSRDKGRRPGDEPAARDRVSRRRLPEVSR